MPSKKEHELKRALSKKASGIADSLMKKRSEGSAAFAAMIANSTGPGKLARAQSMMSSSSPPMISPRDGKDDQLFKNEKVVPGLGRESVKKKRGGSPEQQQQRSSKKQKGRRTDGITIVESNDTGGGAEEHNKNGHEQPHQLLGSIPHDIHNDAASLWEIAFGILDAEAAFREADPKKQQAMYLKSKALPKYVNLKELVNKRKIQMSAVEAKDFTPTRCVWDRIKLFKQVEPGYREKFIRWEIIKLQMLEGIHQGGIIIDSGSGRLLAVPLKMTQVTTDQDRSFHQRLDILNTPAVASEMESIWEEVSQRGNITEATYYALAKVIVEAVFVHLGQREIHQLIMLDAEVDFPPAGIMTKRGFMRYIASLLISLMETHAISEAVNFMRSLHRLWKRSLDFLDITFSTRFTRKDPSLLIPNVTSRSLATDEATYGFIQDQMALSVRIRFGALLTDESLNSMKGQGKLKKHRARFNASKQSEGGWAFFMTAAEEGSGDAPRAGDVAEYEEMDPADASSVPAISTTSPAHAINESTTSNENNFDNALQFQMPEMLVSIDTGHLDGEDDIILPSVFTARDRGENPLTELLGRQQQLESKHFLKSIGSFISVDSCTDTSAEPSIMRGQVAELALREEIARQIKEAEVREARKVLEKQKQDRKNKKALLLHPFENPTLIKTKHPKGEGFAITKDETAYSGAIVEPSQLRGATGTEASSSPPGSPGGGSPYMMGEGESPFSEENLQRRKQKKGGLRKRAVAPETLAIVRYNTPQPTIKDPWKSEERYTLRSTSCMEYHDWQSAEQHRTRHQVSPMLPSKKNKTFFAQPAEGAPSKLSNSFGSSTTIGTTFPPIGEKKTAATVARKIPKYSVGSFK